MAATNLRNLVSQLWEFDQSNQENCGNAHNSQFSGVISREDKQYIQSNIIQAIDQCPSGSVR